MTGTRSPWLLAFAAMSAVHLTLNAAGASPWDSITKCLIMPLLAVWVFTESGPRIIVIALVSYVWSGLENDMLPLVPVYAALLAATAATSLATDLRAGIGGALFLVSDAIIALDLANKGTPQPVQFWIMAFYISALFMLSAGILNREKATRVAGPDINPTLRADGWPPMKAV